MASYPTLGALVRQIRRERFVDQQVDDEKVIGLIVAGYFGFDASAIMRVCSAGLAEANFHDESRAVLELERQVMSSG